MIKTIRNGWTEQYGLWIYELVAVSSGREFRATRCVTEEAYTAQRTRFESEAREDIRKEATHYAQTLTEKTE